MRKLFMVSLALSLAAMISCTKSNDPADHGKTNGSIVLQAKTDGVVIEKNAGTRATEPATGYHLSITGPEGYTYGPTPIGPESVQIDDLKPGNYEITLVSEQNPDLPAFNKPVYSVTTTATVAAGKSTPVQLTATQANVGVKFVFDPSIEPVYPALVAKIEHGEKFLEYGFEQANDPVDIAYFEAPSTLKITLTNGGEPVKIGGEDFKEIDTEKKELWTITLKTSEEGQGLGIIAEVDKETTEKEDSWGIGEIVGAGTWINPYSVAGAINTMPAAGVWVKGIVRGDAQIEVPGTRAAGDQYILIGKTAGAAEKECIVTVVPQGLTMAAAGTTVLLQGDVKGKSDGFASKAMAVMEVTTAETYHTLKEFAFPVGFAVMNGAPLTETNSDYVSILTSNARRVSAENVMKPGQMLKSVDTNRETVCEIDFTKADAFVNFAVDNNMLVHGHTLVWQKEGLKELKWLADQGDQKQYSEYEWQYILKDYITQVVTHFKGRVQSWDVVNEAFTGYVDATTRDDATFLREDDFWRTRAGDDYIQLAFEAAAAADPTAVLFYNDNEMEYENSKNSEASVESQHKGDRREAIYALLTKMRNEQDVPIDGVGLQFHIDEWYTGNNSLSDALEAAAAFGKVHISELDLRLGTEYPSLANIPSTSLTKQARIYKEVFEEFAKLDPAKQFGITIWGVADQQSWSSANWPLLFATDGDGKYQPKPAYTGLLELLD